MPDQRLEWYRRMVLIRAFEDKVQGLFSQGVIEGTTHLCQGQEAVSVGAVAALRAGDVLTNTYRSHGEALALGMEPEVAFAELMGRRGGSSGGVGGSMHLMDVAAGNLGSNAIVGANLPIAVGAAVGFQMQGRPNIALTFCGDGATNIGTFHEAMNMAAVWMAPIVFVVANNLYGEYSPIRATTPIDDLARRADAYGMPGAIVDGQDVGAVHAATAEAVERARRGGGPTLLEMKTYRFRGHSRSDAATYRPPDEVAAWKARDPIELLAASLATEGVLAEGDAAAIRASAIAAIDTAASRAAEMPSPTLEEIRPYVYAD